MSARKLVSFVLQGLVAVMVLGCVVEPYVTWESSARGYSERKDYDNAVIQVVASLKMKPSYDKAQALIVDVFPRAVNAHLDKIATVKGSSTKFKWDTVVVEYIALININNAVKSLPPLIDEKSKKAIILDVKDYTQDLIEPKNLAAEDHYQEGRRLFGREGMSNRDLAAKEFRMANTLVPEYKDGNTLGAEGYYQEGLLLSKNESVDIQKQAAKAFTAAQQFVPGYKDSVTLYEKARRAGVKRIAIISFENKSGKNVGGSITEAIVDGIVNNVTNDSTATEFLEIVSRDQLEQVMREQKLGMTGLVDERSAVQLGKILGVHEIVTGKITQIIISPENTKRNTIRKQRSICINQKIVNGQQRCDRVDNLYADVTTFTRHAHATITGSYSIIDVKTAALKKQNSMEGKYSFDHTWATYYGDERALESEAARPTIFDIAQGRRPAEPPKSPLSESEQAAPVQEELVKNAGDDLIAKLSKSFKDYTR